ncbi:LCP family protein [Streptomyces litchfieldiae]|uniref:LCP family protein n=1 Tax=Streptomyces litchfieldiae TaxID=3075543 RepID=A0ABU2MPA6_9ACTN|nr:LCP family protein [Streptomyces sp. DSM 44938]MDT0342728.1 LCP family protein [Streptomyces sp. DSM 44938]
MNDRQDPYGQLYGYDEYGRPLYGPVPGQPFAQHDAAPQDVAQQGYDYGTGQQPPVPGDWGTGQQAPVADPYTHDYGTGPQPPVYDAYPAYDYGTGQQAPVADPYAHGHDYGTGEQPPVADAYDYGHDRDFGTGEQAPVPPAPPSGPAPSAAVPQQRRPPGDAPDTEQFAFVDENNDESEDVIDWLKFTESRTERREEAKRRGRNRRRLLVWLLVLAVLGGTGFLWATGRLPGVPGLDTSEEAAPGAEVRDVVVVHLRQIDSDETATALLVANETAGTGTTLLLPNDLAVTPDGGPTTLGQAVTDEAAGSVRDSLGGLLGADIKGTWRLDTPYLENLVDLVGGITVTTDAEVPGEDGEEPLVVQGEDVPLNGRAAVAYATHRGEDESGDAQLARFGQVMQAVLAKMPSNESGALRVVEALAQITDPSLTEEELGASLAQLAGYAQDDAYTTTALPVEEDGTLSDETADGLVMDVLGGTVTNADPGATPRIGIRDASGAEGSAETARIALVNGGFTVVDSRPTDEPAAESQVTYADEAHQETALEAARTLGLPEEAVTQGDGAGNADVTIVLGEDYGQ